MIKNLPVYSDVKDFEILNITEYNFYNLKCLVDIIYNYAFLILFLNK